MCVQIIFMESLFGYLVFLIGYKWCLDWDDHSNGPAPKLIDTMIAIALSPGSVEMPLYSTQATVQVALLLIAGCCVPVMLLGKPLVMLIRARKDKRTTHGSRPLLAGGGSLEANPGSFDPLAASVTDLHSVDGSDGLGGAHGDAVSDAGISLGEHEEEHGMGEVMMHQVIETIEFVLGAVSNTASYLRLWALSLAHSQLATVFWERGLVATIEMKNPAAIVVGYTIFAAMSFGVLCMMDVLECFLHALRLHWVEFQNKFYKADGYRFEPFSFDKVYEASD